MIKTMTRLLAATAAVGLVAAPIMASANTRAGAAGTVYSTSNSLPGLGRAADGEGQGEGGGTSGLLIGIAAFGVIAAGAYVAFEAGDDDCASPGAC